MNENKAKQFFHDHIIDMVILLICIAYLGADLINIKSTGKTIEEVLWDGGIAMLVSYGIAQALGLKGIAIGEKSKKVIATDTLLGQKIEEAETKILYLEEWCEDKTHKVLKQRRRSVLSKAGIPYEDVFDEKGNILPYKIQDFEKSVRKRKKKALKEAINIHITTLTPAWLMANDDNEADPFNHSKTKGKYITKTAITGFFTKIVVLVAVGFFVVDELKDFNISKLIWCGLQLAIYLFLGVLTYLRSYSFVTDELRGQKIRRINLLTEYFAEYDDYKERARIRKEKEQRALPPLDTFKGDNNGKIYVQ